MRLLLNWFASAAALYVVAHIVPGIHIHGFGAAMVAVLVIGLVNATLGVLLKIVTFPLTVATLGLFWWVINALMLQVASRFVAGFTVAGFLPALLGAIVLAFVNTAFHKMISSGDSRR